MATTLDEFGRETGSAAGQLGSQTTGSVRDAYTSTIDDVKAATDVRSLKEDAYAAGVATANLGDSATSLVSSVGSSGEAYAELGETAGLVAQEVLVRKLEELRSQLFEMRSVKLKSLLNSTGAFVTTATTPDEFVDSISSNTSKMVGRLPATLKKAATEMAVEVGSDPRVLESLASLKEVQALAKTLDSIYKMYEAVRKIADKFEPYFPIIEITVSAAMIWCTGGGAAAKMSSESAQLAMQELKKIIPLIAKPTKDYIYNKEIRVPAMLIGMLDTLSTQEASDRFAVLKQEAEEYLLADDARYTEINNSLKFPGAYNRLTSTVITKSSLAQAFVEKYLGGSPLASTLMRTMMAADAWAERRDRLEADYSGYVSRHALASCMQDFELRERDIRRISGLIVDNKDTSASFYTDRQMHKLVVAQLARDGCVIDVDREAYDELATATFPEGERLAFKMVNDRIIGLHSLLSGLIGERRANIRETIPVIDFYKRTFTGLSRRYTDDTEFNAVTPIADYHRDDPDIPQGWQFLKQEHPSIINMALDGYPIAEYFYNTRARVSDESNLIVEYTTNLNPRAPGLLNGLFSEKVVVEEATEEDFPTGYEKFNEVVQQLNKVTNDNKPKEWAWVDVRDEIPGRTSNLALGTFYNTYHIMNRGTIVERPLRTTTPGYPGKATEYYTEALEFINSIKTAYTIPTAEWARHGCILDSVVTPDMCRGRSSILPVTFKVPKNWWIPEKTVTKLVRSQEYLVRYPSKIQALKSIDGTYWTNLNQVINGKRWLVIDADESKKVISSVTPNAGYEYVNATVTTYNGSFIIRPVAVYGPTTTGPYGTPPAEPDLVDMLAADPTRHIAVALNPSNFFNWHAGTDRTGRVRNIRIITPIALLGNADADREDTILFSPDSERVPDAMWLASRKNLGFNTTTNRVFASFTRDNRSVALRVTEVHYIDLETDRIKVKCGGSWHTYDPEEDTSSIYANYLPRVEIVGGSCYLYKLESIQANAAIRRYWTPLRSDPDILNGTLDDVDRYLLSSSFTARAKASVHVLKDSMIAVNIPTLSAATPTYAYFNKQGVNYKPFDRMLTEQAVSAYVAAMLAETNIITDAEVEPSVKIKHMHTVLAPWIDASAKNALMGYAKDGAVKGLDKIYKMISRFEMLSKLAWTLQHNKITPAICAEADAKLGNAAAPWIAIGSEPDDDVSYNTLNALVQRIKEDLLGSESQGRYPVRFVEGDDRAEGRVNSLYYQRYMLLNARMHRTEGPLAKAAFLMYNWQIVKDARGFQDAQTENYTDFIDAIAVPQMDELMYVPPKTEAEEGRFYVRALLDDIRQQISDKCMLVCAPCPVKDSCPFYDESTILYMYVPPANTLDIYVKDNELDLLVYEQDEFGRDYLDIKGDNGSRLDAAEMKNRHKVYTEIIHDEDEELDLDVVRETIANKINGFRINENMYVDGLDWLHGGRYGSLVKATEAGSVVADPVKHKYLYDALFIRDQETNVLYGETSATYPVAFDSKEAADDIVHYTGNVRLKKPIDIVMSRDVNNNPIPLSQVSGTSELWLVSDDELDNEGNAMVPLIFLNEVSKLHYDFEFIESGEPIESDTDPRYPGAADVAQWVVNQYKWMDPTEDKYWMPSITKVVRSSKKGGPAVIEFPGRPRVSDVIDPLINKAPPVEDILKGKPYIRNYINFVRKVRFQLSDIRWTKSENRADIELKKKQLASMRTNLRLVLVKK